MKQTGTEHLLLALIKEGENVAVRLLNTLGANVQKIYVGTALLVWQTGRITAMICPAASCTVS